MPKLQLTVDGKDINVDLDELLEIKDVGRDMDRVSALMSYWAEVHASAEGEKVRVDAYYRQWRAKFGRKLLKRDPKLPEWKAKQAIESDPKFEVLKEAIARATHNAITTKGVYESLRTKASMLQSKGAMMRAELDATGMSTPAFTKRSKRAAAKNQERAEKVASMRKLNRSKKPKK